MFESDKLISYASDRGDTPSTAEEMHKRLCWEAHEYPFEMHYTHKSAEEVRRNFWTGVQRDWQKVDYMMDRDRMRAMINN